MPRVYTSASDPMDFCRKCFPSEPLARARYGDIGSGPDDRGNCYGHNAEHPPYEGEGYTCERCNKMLTEQDN